MIAMLIADGSPRERSAITQEAHEQAAKHTDEYWKWIICENRDQLQEVIAGDPRLQMACVDITMQGAVEIARSIRTISAETYMILVADTSVSPTVYMRPSIGAESLLLRPLDDIQIREVLDEAVGTYARRFLNADSRKVFVLENRGARELIEYSRICYFESREKKLFCNTGDEEYPFYGTLDQLAEQLGEDFVRCHRSFLANRKKIERVYLSGNVIELKGNISLPLSRSYKPEVKKMLGFIATDRSEAIN